VEDLFLVIFWQPLKFDAENSSDFCQVFVAIYKLHVLYMPSHTSSCVIRPWGDGVPDSGRYYRTTGNLTH
jgi:hypothetical protein